MGGPKLTVAKNPKASLLCSFSYNLTFTLFQTLFWFEQIPLCLEKVSWIHINLPQSSYQSIIYLSFFFFPFELLALFLLFAFYYTSFVNIPPVPAFSLYFLIEANPQVYRTNNLSYRY